MDGAPAKRPSHFDILGEVVEVQDFRVGDVQEVGGGLINRRFGFSRSHGKRLDDGRKVLEIQVALHGGPKLGERVGQQSGLEAPFFEFGDLGQHGLNHRVLTGGHQRLDFVAGENNSEGGRPGFQLDLDVGNGYFAPLGPMPGVITALMRSEHDGEHGRDVDRVALRQLAQLVGDRSDENSAEVEDHCSDRN